MSRPSLWKTGTLPEHCIMIKVGENQRNFKNTDLIKFHAVKRDYKWMKSDFKRLSLLDDLDDSQKFDFPIKPT